MKIAILIPEFDKTGGTETQTAMIAKHLSKNNEVTVITRSSPGKPSGEKRNNYSILRLKRPGIPLLGSLIYYSLLGFHLFRNRKNTDIAVSMMTINDLSGIVARLSGLRVVLWIRGEYSYITKGMLKKMIFTLSLRSDVILSQTSITGDEISKKHRTKRIEVIPNMIESLNKKSTGKNLLYIGRLAGIKGVKYLIDSIKLLRNPPHLVVVGDGTERKSLERESKSLDISFEGNIEHRNIGKYLEDSSVLIQPSLSEGFPNSVLEAMSYGIPVIATAVGGTPEVLKDRRTGFLVKPENSGDIAEHIKILTENHELREKMSRESLKEAEKYLARNIITKLERILSETIS